MSQPFYQVRPPRDGPYPSTPQHSDPYGRSQGEPTCFAPAGMFDPHARRGWDRGAPQLDPDQQQRYNSVPERHGYYGYPNSHVQMSGQAPWLPEIW